MLLLWDSRLGEDSDGDFRDSSSDGSSDYEHDRGRMSYLREQRSYNHPTGEVPSRMEHLSLHDQHIALQEGFSSDEGESGNSQGCLLFEYLERDPPFGREPLADKVRYRIPLSIHKLPLAGKESNKFCVIFLLHIFMICFMS